MDSSDPPDCTPETTEFALVVARFPEIGPAAGHPDSPARTRFFELLRALWRPGIPIDAIAELTMIYPPRAEHLVSDGDR